MSDYQIQKLRCPAQLTLADGERVIGDIFVQAVSPSRVGPEDPIDVLNDTDPFFPFAVRNRATLILAKRNVIRVDVGPLPTPDATPLPDEIPLAPADPGVAVIVRLTDGSSVEGYVFPITRAARPRLMDFLNDFRDRFLAVVTPDGTSLVNCRNILAFEQRS